MIVDAHLHCSGTETCREVLQALDEAQVDIGVLLAPFLSDDYRLSDASSLRAANEYLGKLVRGHSDRLIGFAVINPASPSACDDFDQAFDSHQLRGLKLVPSGWYPYDECAHALYERASAYGVPILFHSGIFIDGKSGRYCKPVYFEAVREHPGLRVALAHLGWPWTDEANAVGLIDLINGVSPDASQFRFDISFGAPPAYRSECLRKALAVLTPDLLQFGSDRFLPCSGAHIAAAIAGVRELLGELGAVPAQIDRIMSGTACAWLRLTKGDTT